MTVFVVSNKNVDPLRNAGSLDATQLEPKPEVPTPTANLGQSKEVTLAGPLSEYYTQELDKVYAKESMVIMTAATDALAEHQDPYPEDQPSYVYLVNGELLDSQLLSAAFESMNQAIQKKHKVVLCMESGLNVNAYQASLGGYAQRCGIKVVRSRDAAMAVIAKAAGLL